MQYVITLLFLISSVAYSQAPLIKNNRALDQDTKLCVNDGGVQKCPIDIDGTTGKFKGTDGLADSTNPGLTSAEAYVELTGTTNSGNTGTYTLYVSRVGHQVTITGTFVTTSEAAISSGRTGLLPSWALPPVAVINLSNALLTAGADAFIYSQISTSGTVSMHPMTVTNNNTGVATALNGGYALKIGTHYISTTYTVQ